MKKKLLFLMLASLLIAACTKEATTKSNATPTHEEGITVDTTWVEDTVITF